MVVPTDTDFSVSLSAPFERLNQLFVHAAGDDQARVRTVSAAFARTFNTRSRLAKIPALTSLPPPRDVDSYAPRPPLLVRWRCMVQQTAASAEMFVRTLPSGASGYFGAADWTASADASEYAATAATVQPDYTNIAERNVVFGVSIPGETAWQADTWEYPEPGALSPPPAGVVAQKTPLPEKGSASALMKLYDGALADSVRVTDVVEVVGILGYEKFTGGSDFDAPVLDAPLVPVIHVIFLAQAPLTQPPKPDEAPSHGETEAALVAYLASALEGDTVAARAVFYALLAHVRGQRAGVTLGTLSVNLSGLSEQSDVPKMLSHALALLVPALVEQPLSIGALNAGRFFPSSDGDVLRAGRLQLAKGTTLLIDETQLQEGTLADTGVRNVRSLTTLLHTHKLGYAFPFNEYEFDTDMSIIILSSTKSMIPTDVRVVHCPSTGSTSASSGTSEPAVPTPDELANWRAHILSARQADLPALPEALAKQITEEFVAARRSAPQGATSQEDLQRRLNLARLSALAKGSELDEQVWRSVVQLDEQILTRLV